jgi:hypothetical protein
MVSLIQHLQGFVAMALDAAKPGRPGYRAEHGRASCPPERFMLWIDAVGGYRVCLADEVLLGQPQEPDNCSGMRVDIPILADLGSRHACIRRDGENYLIEAFREVRVDGRPVRAVRWLADGSRIELGEGVRLVFRRPHPLSATARLELASHHRTEPPCDAVLLWAETCVLGPQAQSHVVCPDWPQEVVLSRQGKRLFCHTSGRLEIDGVCLREQGPLEPNSRVSGEGFAFSLEPLG